MIREANEQDLIHLVEIEKEIFPSDSWDMKQFLYELNENPFSTIYVYVENNEIVGYCDLWITYEQAQVANIGIKKSKQKLGIGQQLMDYMVSDAIHQECENLTLEVRVSNIPAIRLYEKNGFIQVSIRKKYYNDGEDAYLMIKPIGGLYDITASN